MTCNCKLHKSTSVSTDGTNMIVTFSDPTVAPTDRQAFNFIICQPIPSGFDTMPVYLSIAGTNYPLWNKFGEQARGIDVICNRRFKGWYGATSTAHVITSDAPVSCTCRCASSSSLALGA